MNGEMILFKCIHGSHLYGLNTENSDIDYKGVFLPKLEDLILDKAPSHYRSSTGPENGKNSSGDIDEVYFSLPKFIEMLCQGETTAIDMLHAPSNPDCVLETSSIFNIIYKNRQKFYTSEMKAFMGYCKRQAAKYGIKGTKISSLEEILNSFTVKGGILKDIIDDLPINEYCRKESGVVIRQGHKKVNFYNVLGSKYQDTISIEEFDSLIRKKLASFGDRARLAKENKGIDWKAISHALRAGIQLDSIYTNGDLVYPFTDYDRNFLLNVKKGKLDFKNEVQPKLESVINRVTALADKSQYPSKVDREFWEDFILDVYYSEYDIYI